MNPDEAIHPLRPCAYAGGISRFFRSGETAGKPVGEIAVTAEGGSATVESLDVYELKSIREK